MLSNDRINADKNGDKNVLFLHQAVTCSDQFKLDFVAEEFEIRW